MKESPRAAQAWADYLAMGPGRSLEKLAALYRERAGSGNEARTPTLRFATLAQWSRTFGWQDRLRELADNEARKAAEREAEALAALQAAGIASRENRIEAQNDRWRRMKQVIDERAADPSMANVPGGRTGLLVRQVKLVKVYNVADDSGEAGDESSETLYSAKRDVVVEEYAVDTGLLKEMRELEKQSAIETGQWAEKKELTGANGGPIEVRDTAREELARRIAGLASRLGASAAA